MQKLKSISLSGVLSVIKCCLVGLVATLVGVVVFALVLKFTDLSSSNISYVNNAIKAVSIFVMIICIKKANSEKLMLKSIFGGVVYAVLSFVIFSILNGKFVFNMSILFDLLFAVVVSIICFVIISLIKRKN